MRQCLAKRDLLARFVDRLKIGQVLRDRRIKVDLALLDVEHQQQGGDRFRDRTDAVDRRRPGECLLVVADVAKAFGPDDVVVFDDRDRERGNTFEGDFFFDVCPKNANGVCTLRGRVGLRRCEVRETETKSQTKSNDGDDSHAFSSDWARGVSNYDFDRRSSSVPGNSWTRM